MATPIPVNRASFTLAEIAAATGGEVRVGRASSVTGVTTDSRGELDGALFVALSGERFDGHEYAAEAARSGASAVMLSRDVELDADVSVVRVASTFDGLGALARAHRRHWGGRVIAVAGSAGKTTTKSAIAALLEAVAPGAVHATPGNLNNQVGVPMVIFGLESHHQMAVLEIGTNQQGEIEKLVRVSEPDIGVLTLIALEHSEGLGDLDAIEAEEGALLSGLGPSGAALANRDDRRAARQLEKSPAGVRIGYGAQAGSDYRLLGREARNLTLSVVALERPHGAARERIELETALFGEPGALASLAALAVCDFVTGAPIAPEIASAALGRSALGEPGRLRPSELGERIVVIDDTYNSNPASLRSSIRAAAELASARAGRLVLVLGEMRELGALSRSAHGEAGAALATSGAAALVAVSGDAELFVAPARAAGVDASFAKDAEHALAAVLERVRAGDVVLVKASRGVHAERVVHALAERYGRAS
jgi:UDP-N-acetylmuramoyl-tripeptide--D-alanyl-D-alanine ligase